MVEICEHVSELSSCIEQGIFVRSYGGLKAGDVVVNIHVAWSRRGQAAKFAVVEFRPDPMGTPGLHGLGSPFRPNAFCWLGAAGNTRRVKTAQIANCNSIRIAVLKPRWVTFKKHISLIHTHLSLCCFLPL